MNPSLIVADSGGKTMETIMNCEDLIQDDVLVDLGTASVETLGSVQPNAPDGPTGFLISGGIADE